MRETFREATSPRAAAPRWIPRPAGRRQPFRIGQFFREVRSELRQVAWPNRAEVINYTVVTFATLVLLIGLIFLLNYAFSKGIFWLFKT